MQVADRKMGTKRMLTAPAVSAALAHPRGRKIARLLAAAANCHSKALLPEILAGRSAAA
jgi:hypothetical protein